MKVIRLKESDIQRMVNIVLTEQHQSQQASIEVPKKYNEVIKGIEGISKKINEVISNIQHKSKNIPNARDIQEAGEELKKSFTDLLKLLARTNEVKVNVHSQNSLIQKVDSDYKKFTRALPRLKKGWGSKVDEPLKNLDYGILRLIDYTFTKIRERNTRNRRNNAQAPADRKVPMVSPAEWILKSKNSQLEEMEQKLNLVNKDIEKWWKMVSEQLLGPEETPQLEPMDSLQLSPEEIAKG